MGIYEERLLPHLVHLAMGNRSLLPYRRRLAAAAEGRVLEIGIGSGLNLPFYGPRVTQVLGLDPSPRLLAMARRHAAAAPLALIRGSAAAIPLETATVDTVVTSWSLCTIPDVAAALAEMRRVMRPGGQFLFVEHGCAPDRGVRRWQDALTPAWKRIGGGCHLNRPIAGLVTGAGFRLDLLETGYAPGPRPMTFFYEGRASTKGRAGARLEPFRA